MKPHTDTELAALLSDGESHLVERKRNAGDGEALRRNVCAFANDLPGTGEAGVIFVGVEDDGRCANLDIDDDLLARLAQLRADGSIMPLPTVTVEKRRVSGCEIAVVRVAPASAPPVRYRGRVWVRVGPTVQPASPDDERRLGERRRAGDLPFDMRPATAAAFDDLDAEYARERYLPQAVAADILAENRRPLERQLRSLRLVLDGRPAWGALLGLGSEPRRWLPGAYVQFLRIDGAAITSPIRNRRALTGRLEDVLRGLDDSLASNICERAEIAAAARETKRPDYPIAALRQLAWNAIMHRSYEGTNAPVRVHWYADRVEIENPGGLYGRVTPRNFGQETDYRNPLTAEIMANLGFAQRFGLGIPLARKELARNGNPEPEFAFGPSRVTVTVRPAP